VLRRARGYAPLPVRIASRVCPTLAVGAHLKSAVAFGSGNNVFTSQHLGDLETAPAYAAFCAAASDLPRLYGTAPQRIVHDRHPDYLSTQYAAGRGIPARAIQHHWAHVAACLAENGLEPSREPILGVAWDGSGLGPDGTIWGGEFLRVVGGESPERAAHWRLFRLPGGEAAIREPRRAALGLLYETFGGALWERSGLLSAFSKAELSPLRTMLEKGINAPWTSSAGRLFDAMAALAGLRQRAGFEGQAAMELEFAVRPEIGDAYPLALSEGAPRVIDWSPAVLEIVCDLRRGEPAGVIAAKFHHLLAVAIVAVARSVLGERSGRKVALTGGCFQNKRLAELAIRRLREHGFEPVWHRLVPPNDGGIALGQIAADAWAEARPEEPR